MVKFTVREGRREDCQEMRRLIQELADYEKMPDEPQISAKDLQRDGFDTQPPLFHTFVAELEDKPSVLVGYAIYYYVYGVWTGRRLYLEDICVTESHRGEGIGFALIEKVIAKGVEMNVRDMDFVVLDWNPAQEFYLKLGATDITQSEGWRLFRMTRTAMLAVAQARTESLVSQK